MMMTQKILIDRYQHRPQEIQYMCLADFAAKFVTNYHCKDIECDALPAGDNESTSKKSTYGWLWTNE